MGQPFLRPGLSARTALQVADVRCNACLNRSDSVFGVFGWQPGVGAFQTQTALFFDFKRQSFSGRPRAALNMLAQIPEVEVVNALLALFENRHGNLHLNRSCSDGSSLPRMQPRPPDHSEQHRRAPARASSIQGRRRSSAIFLQYAPTLRSGLQHRVLSKGEGRLP